MARQKPVTGPPPPPIRVLDPYKDKHEEVKETLAKLTVRAEAGEILGLMIVEEGPNDALDVYVTGPRDYMRSLGAIALIRTQLEREAFGEDE